MDIIEHLKSEVQRLESALKIKMRVANEYPPRESPEPRIREIIADLQQLIESLK
jgi:hypothetical protein